jgi:hypothetical protein
VDGEDVASATAVDSVGVGEQFRLATKSVQIGYRAGFQNNITSAATGLTDVGFSAGFSMIAPNQVSVFGQSVGGTVCTSPTNVLLLGTSYQTDCTTATESNVIHIGAGAADIISASGTGVPATSVTKIAGIFNAVGVYQANGTAGLTCSGTPTSSFASTNGIVTHC